MMNKLLFLFAGVTFLALTCSGKGNITPSPVIKTDTPATVAACTKCIVLAEQSQNRIVIADVNAGVIIWEWNPAQSNIQPEHVKWFSNPSDAKAVYNNEYILMNASGGGVALIRIADRKTVFYAYAGGNTHSAELLPDGNIVTASSTGNYLMLFKTDTLHFPANVYTKKVPIAFGHNVVWDAAQQRLWSAAMTNIQSFRYNFDCAAPDLVPDTTIAIPGKEAHDLFPAYGENNLWLTNTTNVYKFDVTSKKLTQADVIQANIKCVSSGPDGFPVILTRPKESWWTDEVLDSKGNSIFRQKGLKIYKARWILKNTFSYAEKDSMHLCDK